MLKFDKFNESVLYNHIIFPCIDELATTDEFLKKKNHNNLIRLKKWKQLPQ